MTDGFLCPIATCRVCDEVRRREWEARCPTRNAKRIVREPTLSLDREVIMRNRGFRAPLLVRARLLWWWLRGRVRPVKMDYDADAIGEDPLTAFGWQTVRDGTCYVVRVEVM